MTERKSCPPLTGLETGEDDCPLDDFAELATVVDRYLNGIGIQPCRVIAARRKMRKVILEFDATRPDRRAPALGRCIGKIYRTDRGRNNFEALSKLWQSGFRPPATFTVVYPIAYIAERNLLLQEKAPGRPLARIALEASDLGSDAPSRAAGWLAALHACVVEAPSRLEQIRSGLGRYGREIAEFLPEQARRLELLVSVALAGLEPSRLTALVPSHGDFHPENVFIADDGRVTGIDFDTFGAQERAADIAYFLAQTAIRGYFHRGSFAALQWARCSFLQEYQRLTAPLPAERLSLYLGMAFLQSLHYELAVLHTGNGAIVEPWLGNSERCLLDGDLTLRDNPVHRA